MSDNKEIESLLKNIQEGLKKYTVQELNTAIVSFLNSKHDKTQEIDFVLKIVCDEFQISKKILKSSKNARGVLQEAKQIAYCLLHFNIGLSIRYISDRIFFNGHTSVFIGVQKFKNADHEHKADKVFIETYNKLQTKLIENLTHTN